MGSVLGVRLAARPSSNRSYIVDLGRMEGVYSRATGERHVIANPKELASPSFDRFIDSPEQLGLGLADRYRNVVVLNAAIAKTRGPSAASILVSK